MNEGSLDQLLRGAVDAVLETMFFSTLLGPAEPDTGTAVLEAHVSFHGRPSGSLAVCLSEPSARLLASGFLGEDEEVLTDSQPGEIVCELTNMLCGSLVSKLESEQSFALGSPELVGAATRADAARDDPPTVRQSFQLENGILTVTLRLAAA